MAPTVGLVLYTLNIFLQSSLTCLALGQGGETKLLLWYTRILFCIATNGLEIVKLRQGSGKDRQGMAVKVKGLKA